MKKSLLLITIILGSIVFNLNNAFGQVTAFYVSTTGNDANSGTEFSPWRTISKATNTLVAGQTAYIRGGTYNENVYCMNSGTAGKYISLEAYPNEKPIVDGTGKSAFTLMNLNGRSYIRIAGIRFQNGSVGIANGKNNILIENNEVANFTNPGIMLNSCSVATVKGNIVDNVCSSSWGECITFAQSEYIDIVNNEVKNGSSTNTLGGEGIDVKGSKHMRIYGNVVHDLPLKLGIYIDSFDGPDYDIEVFNNRVYNCTNGIIISGEQRNAVEQVSVYNNVVYDCTKIGIGVVNWPTHASPGSGYPVHNIKIENNTIYANTVSTFGGIYVDAIQGSDFTIRNNIICNYNPVIKYGVQPSDLTVEKNLANLGSVTVLGTGGILLDPEFVNPTVNDFHLQSTSPAIDAGITNDVIFDNELMSRPSGSANDIGAYEYGASIADTIPIVTKPSFLTAASAISQSSNEGYENASTGIVTLNPTSINVAFTSTTNKNVAAIRFTNIDIPQGATIINARIKVKMSQSRATDNYPIRINAESSSNSPVLTTQSNSISTKTETTNYSNWLPLSCSIGDWKLTPSLDFLLQEIVSRPDWVSGNAVTFILEYTDISTAGLSFVFNAFDINTTNAPQLAVEYTLNNIAGIHANVNPVLIPVKIYPNPTQHFFTIDMQGNDINEISVFDIMGKLVLKKKIEEKKTTFTLGVSNWNRGIYFVDLRNKYGSSSNKIIVE